MFSKKSILPGPGKTPIPIGGQGGADTSSTKDKFTSLPGEIESFPPSAPAPKGGGNLTRQLSRQISNTVRDVFTVPKRGSLKFSQDVPEDMEERRVRDLREAFELFDKDGSGCISGDELASVMRALGQNPTPEEIEDMMNGIDDNSDGEIDFNEFLSLYSGSMNNADDEEFIAWAFESFDTDKSGKLSADEVRRIVLSMGDELSEEEVAEIMDRADLDGDGLLSFQEFTRLIIGD
eukprot:CAMPEP_0177754182 /NCGR_PEP_ID=MMETSP0491_2-20121128/1870_1 /TAXON_ID=63592 /ORGANISM="Tetraselmis chuii, Strain PLY429" /LENGTH=234 /DNA_ID=CAMNT_0019269543 /DNA_START=499 /DNA_END=1203 /DNA_ORIENTATION=+